MKWLAQRLFLWALSGLVMGIEVNQEILVTGYVICQDQHTQNTQDSIPTGVKAVLLSTSNEFSQTQHSINPFLFYIPARHRHHLFLFLLLSHHSTILFSKNITLGLNLQCQEAHHP
jgi:hypothetical protein